VDWRVNGGYCGGGNFIIRKSPKIPFNPLSSTSIFHFPNKPLMENRNLISSLDRIEKHCKHGIDDPKQQVFGMALCSKT
jgi:hypothetical protein